jgi:hypothetical protein
MDHLRLRHGTLRGKSAVNRLMYALTDKDLKEKDYVA